MNRIDPSSMRSARVKPNDKATEYVICDCGNSWFEEFRVARVSKLHMVIPGQEVPKVGSGPFVLLRCVKCNELYEPNLTAATTAHLSAYNDVMKEIGGTDDREETEEVYPAVHPSAAPSVKAAADRETMSKSKTKKAKSGNTKKEEEVKSDEKQKK